MDCYLPADFFLVDDARRSSEFDDALGADAHVHIDATAYVTGLRDWSRPRGAYPRQRPRRAIEPDGEWQPL